MKSIVQLCRAVMGSFESRLDEFYAAQLGFWKKAPPAPPEGFWNL